MIYEDEGSIFNIRNVFKNIAKGKKGKFRVLVVSWNSKYEKKEWFTREEINKAISEVKKWEHHDLSRDWEIELLKELGIDVE